MTKKQAIEKAKEQYSEIWDCDIKHPKYEDTVEEIVTGVIRLIMQPTSDDCVSRAEVFEIMGNLMSIPYDFDRPINEDDVSESMDKIKALSPVTPTRKVGKILVNDKYRIPMYECLGCKHLVMEFWKYCPNCGAEMRVVENG